MDNKIVKLIQEKDRKGMDLLINAYSKNIYYISSTIIGDFGSKEDIEESVSDTLLAIWKDIDKFNEDKGSFKTFILIKSKYIALDYRRKLSKIKAKFDIEDIEIADKTLLEDNVTNNEKLNEILSLVKEFKEPDKTYFYLRYFRDYSINSIVEKFNDTKSGVENRLYRCRNKIKDKMGKGVR